MEKGNSQSAKKPIFTLYIYNYDAWDEYRTDPREELRESFDTKEELMEEYKLRKDTEPAWGEFNEVEAWEGVTEEGVDFEETCDDCRCNTLLETQTNTYQHYANLDGAVILDWQWHRYIGYARNLLKIREKYAFEENEGDLFNGNQEYTGKRVSEVLATKEEMEGLDKEGQLELLIRKLTKERDYKWTCSHEAIERIVKDFLLGEEP